MKKLTQLKKLHLGRETLRNLSEKILYQADGAGTTACTVTCTTQCSGNPGCQGTNNCTTIET
jgi:hypothetical protein